MDFKYHRKYENNNIAEYKVVSFLISTNESSRLDLISKIEADCFTDVKDQKAVSIIKEFALLKKKISFDIIKEALVNQDDINVFNKFNWNEYKRESFHQDVSYKTIPYLLEKKKRLDFAKLCEKMKIDALNNSIDTKEIDEIIGAMELGIVNLNESTLINQKHEDQIRSVVRKSRDRSDRSNNQHYRLGFDCFDSPIGSMVGGELFMMVGEAGVGKTRLIMSMINKIKDSYVVIFFSLEMGSISVYDRMALMERNISRSELDKINMDKEKYELRENKAVKEYNHKWYLYDQQSMNVDGLKQKIRAVKKETGKNPLVFVDSFSEITTEKHENQVIKEGELILALNRLIKSENVPLAILHHTGKDGKFRGSQQIKDKVDFMVLLESPDSKENEDKYICHRFLKIRDQKGAFVDSFLLKIKDNFIKEVPKDEDLSKYEFIKTIQKKESAGFFNG